MQTVRRKAREIERSAQQDRRQFLGKVPISQAMREVLVHHVMFRSPDGTDPIPALNSPDPVRVVVSKVSFSTYNRWLDIGQ